MSAQVPRAIKQAGSMVEYMVDERSMDGGEALK